MSLNDLFNSEGFLFLLLTMFAIAGIAIFISARRAIAKNNLIVESYDVRTKRARVVSRQLVPNPANRLLMRNQVVFELEDGQRLEFSIQDATMIAGIVEGDTGMLRYQGPRFIGFRRETQ